MKLKHVSSILILLFFGSNGYSQATKNNQLENNLNELIQNLQSNPDNPLNVDSEILNNLANVISDPQQKSLLQSYSKNLGSDSSLSFRQIYFDLQSTLTRNNSLLQNPQYMQLSTNLNLMFDNYNLLSNKIESVKGNYEFGVFLNDPVFISNLSNATGSYENAMAISLGIELITTFTEAAAENKKFREDYLKLAAISKNMLYVEIDKNLNGALIDACLSIKALRAITQIYRYDFNSGSSLRVEGGILKLINPSKNISRNLLVVDKKHDGEYYSSMKTHNATIKISPSEKTFYLYVNTPISDVKCPDCLETPGTGYIIDSESGEILVSEKNFYTISEGQGIDFDFVQFKDDISLQYPAVRDSYFLLYRFNKSKDEKFFEKSINVDLNRQFILNRKPEGYEFNINRFSYNPIFLQKENGVLSMFWANNLDETTNTTYTSSMLQIGATSPDKKGFLNPDGMINQLTGVTMSQNKDLYFVSKDGRIGLLKSNEYQFNDPDFTSKINKAYHQKVFPEYDFTKGFQYITGHGSSSLYANRVFPILKFSPDEKQLIYVLKDSLFIVDVQDFTNIKKFKLNVHPYGFFFTKEQGDWVINIQGWNDYKFWLVKKYSLQKMINNYKEIKKIDATNSGSAINTDSYSQSSNTGSTGTSVAQEIKQLKELLDQGVITQEEFEAGKKKVLSSPEQNSTTNTQPKNTNASSNNTSNTKTQNSNATKNCDAFKKFTIEGKSYYGMHYNSPSFEGTYNYKFGANEIRTWKGAPEEPIVKLNGESENYSGIFQYHEPTQHTINWWIECDANCNPIVVQSADGTFKRYTLIIQFMDENYTKYDRISLDEMNNGEMVILGERVKK